MIGPRPASLSGILWIRVAGVRASALDHFLRALTCFREDSPTGAPTEPVPEGLIDAQSALAGYFSGDAALSRRYPGLLGDRGLFRIAAIADPCATQAEVYRHLLIAEPDLPERRPRVFGSLEQFLESRNEPVTTALGAALGRRAAASADFDAIVVADEIEKSLRMLASTLSMTLGPNPPRRLAEMLRLILEHEGALRDHFSNGEETATDGLELSEAARRRYAERNPRDARLHREALARLARPRLRRRRTICVGHVRRLENLTDPVFVFNHLPKCYGTSLREWLQSAFGILEDHTRFLGREGALDVAPACVERLAADTVFCGHFAHGDFLLPRRYPEIWAYPGRYPVFTFVRDPLDTAISNYRHVVDRYPDVAAGNPELFGSLSAYLLALKNPIARRLGMEIDPAAPRRYFFIGAAENAPEGLVTLVREMGRILDTARDSATVRRARQALSLLATRKLRHANAGAHRAGHENVPPDLVREFRERNALDFQIHRVAMADPLRLPQALTA